MDIQADQSNNNNRKPASTDDQEWVRAWQEALTEEQFQAILEKRTKALAEPPALETEGSTFDVIVFEMGDEIYALETTYVQEIQTIENITPVPRTPDYVVGIASIRGQLLSIVDLVAFLGLGQSVHTPNSKIIVVANEVMEMGLLVDNVNEVIKLYHQELTPPLTAPEGERRTYVLGLVQGNIVVLDIKNLLTGKSLIVQQG